jgi:hypothetical protein
MGMLFGSGKSAAPLPPPAPPPSPDMSTILAGPSYGEGEPLPLSPAQKRSRSAYEAETEFLGDKPKRTEQLESAIDYSKEGYRDLEGTPEGYVLPSLKSYEGKVLGQPISLRKRLFDRQKGRSI